MLECTSCFCGEAQLFDGEGWCKLQMTDLQYLHETSDIQLGIQCQIMHVCNECSNFLFETMKAALKCIKRLRVAFFVFVIRVIVIRARVWSVRVMLLSFGISRRRLWMGCWYIFFAYETLDILLGVANATGEL